MRRFHFFMCFGFRGHKVPKNTPPWDRTKPRWTLCGAWTSFLRTSHLHQTKKNTRKRDTWRRFYLKTKKNTMWRFIFLGELVFPARTFHNTARLSYEPEPSRSLQLKKKPKNKPKTKTFQKPSPQWNTIKQGENHVAFYLFLVSWFSQPEPSTTQPVWVTNRNLPEAYSSKKTKKQTQNENLPEAFTSVKYNKTGGKPCGVFTFFAQLVFPARTFHNTARLSYEPEPSRSLQLKENQKTNPKRKPSRSLHLSEIQ